MAFSFVTLTRHILTGMDFQKEQNKNIWPAGRTVQVAPCLCVRLDVSEQAACAMLGLAAHDPAAERDGF
jgi:hypothetical protein